MTMLRFGVNHTPSGDWFYDWLRPDHERRRRDFDAIASLGMDHVRILPLWPVLQPNRTLLRSDALHEVRVAVETAAEFGLDASVDVLQGHLSGFDFIPSWLTSWHAGNMFTDRQAIAAQVQLVEALDAVLHDLPNFLGLTLGNEVNQFSATMHPTPMSATSDDITAWLTALHDAQKHDPRHFRLNAEYDAVWYDDTHPFVPAHASRHGDMSVIHSWVFNGTAQRYGGMSQQSLRHAEYLVELSRAFALHPNRLVWLQEVGAPLNHIDAVDAPDFLEATVRSAADSDSLWGVTWWCSHDINRRLGDFPELEHSLGLFDETGAPKPIARRFGQVANELRQQSTPPPRRTLGVVIPVDDKDVPVNRAELGPGGGVFQTWMDAAIAGERPALVTSVQARTPSSLAERGITSLRDAPVTGTGTYSAVSDPNMFPPTGRGGQ